MDINKKIMQTVIRLAIDSVTNDIRVDKDPARNKTRSETIKTLAEAYATVSGKGKGKA